MPWSGWPAEWETPNWFGRTQALTDTAWACLDSNTRVLSTMPPYLVGAAPTLNADWLNNPDPLVYASWEEFAKQLFWNYQCVGEAFVLATAWYSTGWPARFHVLPPWTVNVTLGRDGLRRYAIGEEDVTTDLLHIRYQSHIDSLHGCGPLEAGGPRLVAAQMLARYASRLIAAGGIPTTVLTTPTNVTADQAASLQSQWVEARMSSIGLPAVLSGGLDFKVLSMNPKDMALVELAQFNEARIAILLGVPPFCVGLPSGGDSMTYSNVQQVFDYRWRETLKPMASTVMSAVSGWALPRGTTVELNRDEFVRPGPLERAQTDAIWHGIVDVDGNPAKTVAEIREGERFGIAAPSETLTQGVLQ
jgi:HK97 family phage portal protein